MRSKVGMKYDDNKWLTVDKNAMLNELYKLGGDMLALWAEKKDFLTNEMKICYENFFLIKKEFIIKRKVLTFLLIDSFNKISKKVLKTDIKEELNKSAYIYTKNNDALDI